MRKLSLLALFLALPAFGHPAWGIVTNAAGDVYFTDLITVWRIDHVSGALSVARPGVEGTHVHDLAVDRAGNVYGPAYTYVSEAAGYRTGIWKIDTSGRVTILAPPVQNPPRGLGIWRDDAGNTYTVEEDNHLRRETLIIKRTPAGQVSVLAGSAYGFADGTDAHARFSNIVAMTIGPGGDLYVTDSNTVRRITPGGVVTTLARNLDAPDPQTAEPLSFGSPFGLAVTPSRAVYVADLRYRRVLRVMPNGTVSVVLRAEPPWSPVGVAVAPNGDLYVMEVGFRPPSTWMKPRIRKLSNGRVSTVAVVRQ